MVAICALMPAMVMSLPSSSLSTRYFFMITSAGVMVRPGTTTSTCSAASLTSDNAWIWDEAPPTRQF